MHPRFEYGDSVRTIRNVRNDGTFPGVATGTVLVRRGSIGFVRDVGTFLQDQIVYSVHFMEADRLVGCREAELQGADEPWQPSRFEFLDKVSPRVALAVSGEVVARPGDEGQVLKVLRGEEAGVQYHVRIRGRTLQVGESSLDALEEESAA